MNNTPNPQANKTIICARGRCSTWGSSWKYHMWTCKEKLDEERTGEVITHKQDYCFRCGMTKKEASNE